MGLSRTVFEINGYFSRKSPIFPTPVYLTPSLKGFPLELGIGAGDQKKLEWCGYRAEEEVWQYLQPCAHNPPTWQTHGRTTVGQTDRHRTSKDLAYA